MKTRYALLALVAFVASLFATSSTAQGPPAPPEITEHHKVLHKDIGTWKGTMKVLTGPAPMEFPITEKNTKFGDGVWIITEFDGGPFQGRGTMGYDPVKEKYVGTWIDNMSPVQMTMTGNYNEEKGTLTTYAKFHDVNIKKDKHTKSVSKHNEDGTRSFKMYERMSKEDEWKQVFEISYEKKAE